MTINVIQHDDRLRYLRLFYNGTFSIASKNDLDDQNLLLATVHIFFYISATRYKLRLFNMTRFSKWVYLKKNLKFDLRQ
jgi:hypothetical protein